MPLPLSVGRALGGQAADGRHPWDVSAQRGWMWHPGPGLQVGWAPLRDPGGCEKPGRFSRRIIRGEREREQRPLRTVKSGEFFLADVMIESLKMILSSDSSFSPNLGLIVLITARVSGLSLQLC